MIISAMKNQKEYSGVRPHKELFTLVLAVVLYAMNQILTGTGLTLFCGKIFLTVSIYIIAFVLVFSRNKQFKNLLSILLKMINKKR